MSDPIPEAQIKTCFSIFDDNNLLIFSNGHLFPVELIKTSLWVNQIRDC